MRFRNNDFATKILLLLSFFNLTFLTQAEEIYVTGEPASVGFIKALCMKREWRKSPQRHLYPGEQWTGPRRQKRIINLGWTPPQASLLALSDHPEKIQRIGSLISGGLTKNRALTFQYYHLGLLDGLSPNLTFYIYNPGVTKAILHLQKGIGTPSLDLSLIHI